jgi:hypothetical protein
MNFWEYKKLNHTTFMISGGDTFEPTEENSSPVFLIGGEYDGLYWPKHNSWGDFMLLRNTREGESTDKVRMHIYKHTGKDVNEVPAMEFQMFAVSTPPGESPCDPNFKHTNHNNLPDITVDTKAELAYRFSKESSNE